MVNNSALPETRGLVNGIGQSLVAIARSIGPTNGALLFAWSESNGRLSLLSSFYFISAIPYYCFYS